VAAGKNRGQLAVLPQDPDHRRQEAGQGHPVHRLVRADRAASQVVLEAHHLRAPAVSGASPRAREAHHPRDPAVSGASPRAREAHHPRDPAVLAASPRAREARHPRNPVGSAASREGARPRSRPDLAGSKGALVGLAVNRRDNPKAGPLAADHLDSLAAKPVGSLDAPVELAANLDAPVESVASLVVNPACDLGDQPPLLVEDLLDEGQRLSLRLLLLASPGHRPSQRHGRQPRLWERPSPGPKLRSHHRMSR
jgi:hypothetical protein